jgi:hypothetical protein
MMEYDDDDNDEKIILFYESCRETDNNVSGAY